MTSNRLSTLLVTLLFASACGGGNGPARKSVLVYTPHGKELLGHYKTEFEKLRPDVEIQWLDMGSQEVFDRVSTERNRPQASIWWGGPNVDFDRASREGLLEPYKPSWSDAIDTSYRHPQNDWYGVYLTPEVITYNNETVKDSELPSTWDDLLDPKWRDRIIIRYPLASGTMRTIFCAMIMRQESVQEGYKWLARLDMNTKTYAANPSQLYIKVARREGDITLWNMPDTDLQARDNNYPFSYSIPEEGTPVLTEGLALVKGGPNLDLAKEFYEFVSSKEAIVYQAQNFHRIPARTDIDSSEIPEWMTTTNFVPMDLDWDSFIEHGAEWMQHWDDKIKGRGEEYLASLMD